MNRRLIIRPEAEVDITNAALWYEERERGVGRRLLSEFRAAIERVVTQPEAFSRIREKPRVHRVLLRRFPYRIFYILTDDSVIVFAVLHGARHERQWKKRV